MDKEKQINLKKQMNLFAKSNFKSSIWQILNTFLPFIVLWYLAFIMLDVSYVLTILLSIINAGFLVRMFIIFHDCCHYSFFKSRKANDVFGTFVGVMTLFPYRQWQKSHSTHHASSGNLDKRGIGDIWLLTVDEYMEASFWKKVKYRLYRNPIVMFIIGPIYVFLIAQRFNKKEAKRKERVNTYITNIFIALLMFVLYLMVGWKALLIIQGTTFFVSGSVGIWLFYVQHQFEDSYFEWETEWEYVKAAVEGSSFYKLPKILQWLTGSIGYHHVHHLSPKIPNYNLELAHSESHELKNVPTINVLTSLKSFRFRLWDEENKKFINFNDISKIKKEKSI